MTGKLMNAGQDARFRVDFFKEALNKSIHALFSLARITGI